MWVLVVTEEGNVVLHMGVSEFALLEVLKMQ